MTSPLARITLPLDDLDAAVGIACRLEAVFTIWLTRKIMAGVFFDDDGEDVPTRALWLRQNAVRIHDDYGIPLTPSMLACCEHAVREVWEQIPPGPGLVDRFDPPCMDDDECP